jgi:hypothetical protein
MLTWYAAFIVQSNLSGAAMDRDVVKAKTKRVGPKRERTVGPNGFFRDELPTQILKREHVDTKNKVLLLLPPSHFFLFGPCLLPIILLWHDPIIILPMVLLWHERFRALGYLQSPSCNLVPIFRRSECQAAPHCPGSGLHKVPTSEQGLQVRRPGSGIRVPLG